MHFLKAFRWYLNYILRIYTFQKNNSPSEQDEGSLLRMDHGCNVPSGLNWRISNWSVCRSLSMSALWRVSFEIPVNKIIVTRLWLGYKLPEERDEGCFFLNILSSTFKLVMQLNNCSVGIYWVNEGIPSEISKSAALDQSDCDWYWED